MQPSVWFAFFLVTIYCCLVFSSLLPISLRLGKVALRQVRFSGPSLGYCHSLAGVNSCSLPQSTLWIPLTQSSMSRHSAVCCVNYCVCLPQLGVNWKCPRHLFSFCFSCCQRCWGPVEQWVSRMCSPNLLSVTIFLLLTQTSEIRGFSYFWISTHHCLIHWQDCCRLLSSSSWGFVSWIAQFQCCLWIHGRIQCHSSLMSLQSSKLSGPQSRDCLLHQVEGCSVWSRSVLVLFLIFFSLLY